MVNMRNIRKSVFSLLIIVMALALAACSSGNGGNSTSTPGNTPNGTKTETPNAEKKLKIGFTVANLANTYFVDLSEGVKTRAQELGYTVTVHDGKGDAANQVSAVENFITQKMDVIVISPVDEKALEPAVKEAKKANIVVISSNQNIVGSDAFLTVPEHGYGSAIGEVAGKWIAEKLNGEAEVAIIDFPELKSIIERADGIREAIIKHAPNAKIVANQSANTVEKGMKAMETILQAHPNVKVVAAVNDAGALGVYEVVKAAKKDTPDFFIGGLDATQEALQKIKEDTIYRATIDIDPNGMGKQIVDTAVKVMQDGPIAEPIAVNMKTVTIDNAADFIKE
ncbi:sugar ABC transporter substrate-binding protein [Paenibacillus eucommiae]|uniref:ABC-type sugar transport system substrate-binding protein n=1 Tax=Paenibacillus eucommiae TaxID=1355755 RepID=A0ABS4J447_9BACL|nr:sugar ABC transporter substrate-binding protein [Paenibacillus eucommiae]MBP1993866.1 ABC-type sugar transport system substrate-binding protein [Paenibacillus eucommiae]